MKVFFHFFIAMEMKDDILLPRSVIVRGSWFNLTLVQPDRGMSIVIARVRVCSEAFEFDRAVTAPGTIANRSRKKTQYG